MRLAFVIAIVALTACGVRNDAPAPSVEAANLCPASTSSTWAAGAGTVLSIDAATTGADCAQATATIAIHAPGGATVWRQSYPAEQLMTLAGASTPEDMQRRLGEWIVPGGAAADSTGDLPQWSAQDDSPMNGEFPFYPEEGIDRTTYAALRSRDAPMYCYVQGMESLACLAWDNGALTLIGVQTFPG
jgi:hypothetical protein